MTNSPNSNRRPRSDAPTALLHWLAVIALTVSILTGLRISADALDAKWSAMIEPILLQGSVTVWHVWSAYGLTIVVVAYVVFLLRSQLASRIKLDALRFQALTSGDRSARWRAVNVVLYWIAFTLLAVAAISGTILYFDMKALPHEAVAVMHRVVAWGVIAYVVAHIVGQAIEGGVRQLLKIMAPRAAYGAAAGGALLFAGAAAAAVYMIDSVNTPALRVARVTTAPVLDGDPSDDVWKRARVVEIHTVRGSHLPGGEVTVRARAVHDRDTAYFLFQWPDSTRSQKHLPILKTAEGWKVLENRYGIQDEDDYYEDKFAVMLSYSSELAGGGSTQLGPHPISTRPGPLNGRGLHYTRDGSIVDVWHWKSVRTGPLGQADDNYFGPPMAAPEKAGARYTGGYTQDPATGGGFQQNWKKLDKGLVQPLRLPKNPAILARLGKIDLDPNVGDEGEWWLPLADTVPYKPELDTYPVGTVIPSVLIDTAFSGDRGDVRAKASWKDGWWHMEMARKLDTGSKYDVPIRSGISLWVAVFDHTQTRHSRHLHAVRIEVME